ncbi:MAG: YadA-like family protein, partial [Synergistaceae bacterium]|nr:YadA-like family protein [Candidatus Equadaptatus faecalis]
AALRPDTLTIDGHDYITTAGINANGKEIANVKAAEIALNGNYAATTGQLYETNKKIETKADKATTLLGYGITDAYTKISVDDKVANLNNRIDNIEVSGSEAIGAKKIDETNDKAASAQAKGSISEAFNSGVSTNSTAGIAIGYGATVGYENGEITTDPTKDTTAEKSIAIGYGSTVTGANSIAVGTGHTVSGNNSGAFGDPNVVTGNGSYAVGNDNVIEGDNNFVLGSNVKMGANVKNSVAFGSADGKSLEVTESNTVAVGGRTISGLADGINPTDAVTVRQVDAVRNELGSVSNEVKEVGAISAALAGLHFVEPTGEEGDKLVGAVAYGGYRGANAEAIGLAYKPNPNMMLSASTSISNGNDSQNAYNVGFSLKFGKGETAKTRAELQKQVKYLNEKTIAQDAENAVLKGEIEALKNDNEAIKKENAEIKEMLKKLIK